MKANLEKLPYFNNNFSYFYVNDKCLSIHKTKVVNRFRTLNCDTILEM